MNARCRCTVRVIEVDGKRAEGVERLDADCPIHGLRESWPPGHPLQKHARYFDPNTGRTISQERRYDLERAAAQLRRLRIETPRETEARLRSEAA